ncbi:uncharacterized protein LOC132884871 [Neoarius graeffei]|uniref:uncharacterized protein LOC132884871 n=1 Tax=Neoarius graeffei TaxID=443677 RepID=UPI00298C243D|nr:uncharacterized protein LOC132884871 [Neoarius graeffei]
MLGRYVFAYIDDILIYSPDEENHCNQVQSVLKRPSKNHLYVKAEKCKFHMRENSFLGCIISAEGVSMDPSKVTTVTSWPILTSVKELQCFLGFANFYRCFIRGFSIHVVPLTSLLKKGPKHLHWNHTAEEAFDRLKAAFTTAPILQHPDLT